MVLDRYCLLGRSGFRVSRLALGTMTFGTEWGVELANAPARYQQPTVAPAAPRQ